MKSIIVLLVILGIVMTLLLVSFTPALDFYLFGTTEPIKGVHY